MRQNFVVQFVQLWTCGLPWELSWQTIYLQCKRPRFDSWVGKIHWRDRLLIPVFLGFPYGSAGKETACIYAGDLGSVSGLRRFPGEGKGHHSSFLAWRISWIYSTWGCKQLNMTEWLPLHFEALVVRTLVGIVVEKTWVLSVDQCPLQALQFLMHLINLLSALLRWNGFTGILKCVVDQTTKYHQTIKQWWWPSFDAIFGLGSAMELLTGFPGGSDDKESACIAGDPA